MQKFHSTIGACLVLAASICGSSLSMAAQGEGAEFRLALSDGLLGQFNRNDAIASIMAWGEMILTNERIVARTVPKIYDNPQNLFEAIDNGELDAATVATKEFVDYPMRTPVENIYLVVKGGEATERYVLLVNTKSDIENVEGLAGKHLEFHQDGSTPLALAWLDKLVLDESQKVLEDMVKELTYQDKVARTIHRVFFGQTDGCVVTQRAFALATELNPQVGKSLRVVETSEELISSFLFFRPSYDKNLQDKIQNAILSLHKTVAGQQVVDVFQGDRLIMSPVSALDATCKLLVEHKRVRETFKNNSMEGVAASVADGQ